VNFGGAGAVIGHELTHGFDDQGRQFDARGNLKDWWTPADAKAFEDRARCFVDQYSSLTAVDDVKLNGKLTLGENTADNGGLRISLMAYLARAAREPTGTIDGFTPEQRLFLGWGQVWCDNMRPELARMLAQTNPHSPAATRQRRRLEHARIPEGVLVQGGCADGAAESNAACGDNRTTFERRARRARRENMACELAAFASSTTFLSRRVGSIVSCDRCPRLRRYCRRSRARRSARIVTRSTGAGRCPASAIPNARLLLVALAPAAHGANRTGRVFTGDGPMGSETS
jgi:hypothetical protein